MSSSDVDQELYNIAKIIFEERRKSAWGKNHTFKTTDRKNYYHNPEADFDLCLASAKGILNAGYKK